MRLRGTGRCGGGQQLVTVVSDDFGTITGFKLILLHLSLLPRSQWVSLHRMRTPRVPAKRFYTR